MSEQRWFARRIGVPRLEEIGRWAFASGTPTVSIVTHLLRSTVGSTSTLYQVPLVYRDSIDEGMTTPAIGVLDGLHVYDAPRDPAYAAALLTFIADGTHLEGESSEVTATSTAAIRAEGFAARVLTGEQSNTSIIYERDGSSPVICKVFRALHNGENPDVMLQTALAAHGSDAVPAPVGHLVGTWADPLTVGGRARGHLAFAQEFLPGVEDGWRVALAAAAAGRDFSVEARALGAVTARVHTALAVSLGHEVVGGSEIAAVQASMSQRLADSRDEVPEFAGLVHRVRGLISRTGSAKWPDMQRIHGDLHLGQALEVPGRGWVLVDFEGEPLRSMFERNQVDSPLRDVAGMLHSFGYVSGALRLRGDSHPRADWSSAARAAFIAGYADGSPIDLAEQVDLITAYEIDKALYQSVYEVRNRPEWLPISVAAVQDLVGRGSSF